MVPCAFHGPRMRSAVKGFCLGLFHMMAPCPVAITLQSTAAPGSQPTGVHLHHLALAIAVIPPLGIQRLAHVARDVLAKLSQRAGSLAAAAAAGTEALGIFRRVFVGNQQLRCALATGQEESGEHHGQQDPTMR